MTKNYFLNQAESFTSEPENEGTFLGSKEKNKDKIEARFAQRK